MYDKIKNELKEIVQIVNDYPPSLQEKCFEVLLEHLLLEVNSSEPKPTPKKAVNGSAAKVEKVEKEKPSPASDSGKKNKEIKLEELHKKTQTFLDAGSIPIERINTLYRRKNGSIFPVYKDLGTDQPNVAQTCLALLSAFENSFFTGGFEFDLETVEKRCKDLNCFDEANFNDNFNNVTQLFEDGAEFIKGNPIKLSVSGLQAVTEVLNNIK